MTPRQRRKARQRRAEALAVQRAEFVLRFGCTQREWQAMYAEALGIVNFAQGTLATHQPRLLGHNK